MSRSQDEARGGVNRGSGDADMGKAASVRAEHFDLEMRLPTIAAMGRLPGSALLVTPDPFTVVHRAAIIQAAEQYRIPANYSYRQHVREGALMSYGADTIDIFRRSADQYSAQADQDRR
jgi:hypothetical protein